jgi:transcription elongation factor S-II
LSRTKGELETLLSPLLQNSEETITPTALQTGCDLLTSLKSQCVTGKTLAASKLNETLNALRKVKNATVVQLTKEVVQAMKRQIDDGKKSTPSPSTPSTSNTQIKDFGNAKDNDSSLKRKRDEEKSNFISESVLSIKKYKLGQHSVPIRNKCQNMFYDELLKNAEQNLESQSLSKEQVISVCVEIAYRLEECVHTHYSDMEDYKGKAFFLRGHLRDSEKPQLKKNLLQGSYTVEEFVQAAPESLVSETLKKEFERQAIIDGESRMNAFDWKKKHGFVAETSIYTCKKCKQNRCSFEQKQMRSADEAMSEFITCMNCGHAWREN